MSLAVCVQLSGESWSLAGFLWLIGCHSTWMLCRVHKDKAEHLSDMGQSCAGLCSPEGQAYYLVKTLLHRSVVSGFWSQWMLDA
jgi:hypothetical protein